MKNLAITLKDELTNETIHRNISATNAMNSGSVCYELGTDTDQKNNIERWISERGNNQHETILSLVSWEFINA